MSEVAVSLRGRTRTQRQVRYLLVNPPLTDPTAPYHSICYLVGATAEAGHTGFTCLDANLEALEFLARPDEVERLLDECAEIRTRVEASADGVLTRRDELAYRYALKAVGMKPDSAVRAVEILRDPDRFYDYPSYRQATTTLTRWLDVLSVRGVPGQFMGFNVETRGPGNLANLGDLAEPDLLEMYRAPFAPYLDGPFTDLLRRQPWDVVGLSVNFLSQSPYALLMCRLVRSVLPDCVLIAGGTEISDEVKYLTDPARIWEIYPDCDALVVGEGETALVEILDAVAAGEPVPAGRPGIVLRGDPRLLLGRPDVRFEDLASIPPPRYDIWDWSRYWSPEPVVLYSPTRGCYWNKCTFCDYGLNDDGPTSPARVRPIDAVIDEMQSIMVTGRSLYLSVDAISPVYLRQMARAIIASGLSLRWSAELRLERSLLKGLAQELRDAGCVAISFGYESGSQRVLDLIDKGVKIQQVPSLLRELDRVGIGVQMMGFVGFPSETLDESRRTVEFLQENDGYWALAGIGDFVLTPGAIVAKQPADFGVGSTGGFEGDDIVRFMHWSYEGESERQVPAVSSTPTMKPLLASLLRFPDDRPFVGGIDSSHSILYFAQYGSALVREDLRWRAPDEVIVGTARHRTAVRDAERLLGRADVIAFHRRARDSGGSARFADIRAWLDERRPDAPVVVGRDGDVVDVFPNGEWLAVSVEELAVEASAGPAYRLLKDLLLREVGAA